ncbi:hypothetical protein CRV01_03255 [Arcobacter sp. CECT 8983]|uniref:hypothetical protein n=1 Tax=Arcobacter sp. CECT 8983 TaxID=2044508 RepID=UPI00100C2218|nr:hypothetical protein [Arcobacter sp. CECT 8983]RXJ90193.1 hypothetical protein CRV01_03255 [Arcobacter sp. CECT 8983]
MAEKTDQEIIEELGLEQDNNQTNEEDTLQLVDNEENSSSDNPVEENIQNTEENLEYEDNTIENEDLDEEPIQKKKPKVLKILIGVIAALSVILTLGTILFLAGFFDEEEKVQKPIVKQVKEEKKPEVDINIDDIDKNKLNQKLKMLTKTEILNKEQLEAEERKIKEEERKKEEAKQKAIEEEKRKAEEKIAKEKEALEKEKQLLEERQMAIKKEQEEFLKLQEQIRQEFKEQKAKIFKELEEQKNIIKPVEVKKVVETSNNVEQIIENAINEDKDTTVIIEPNSNTNEEEKKEVAIAIPTKEEANDVMNSNLFLPFINVAIIKGELHKSYLDKVESFDKKISLCRDSKNRIEIYFGPYESSVERNKVFSALMDNGFKDSFLVDFTKEEYQKRCNY